MSLARHVTLTTNAMGCTSMRLRSVADLTVNGRISSSQLFCDLAG